MDLYIGIPLFTRAGNDELLVRYSAIDDWITKNEIAIKDKYRLTNISCLTLSPEQVLKCVINPKNIIEIKYPSLVTKGLAVRLHILTVLDRIDRKDTSKRDDSYYLMIDGSGAFDFSNLYLLLDKLCGIPKYDVVLGKRPPEESGMAKWRKNIELFEEYLIYKKFKKSFIKKLIGHNELPDSQAGCWGMRLSVMKHISLTARSYELEYDLLVSSLENGIKIGFTESLKMAPRNMTDFGRELDETSMKQCVNKMEFIVHRLSFERNDVPKSLNEYLKEGKQFPNQILPDLYIKEMEHFGLS